MALVGNYWLTKYLDPYTVPTNIMGCRVTMVNHMCFKIFKLNNLPPPIPSPAGYESVPL